jgi:hypothetical protein
VLPELHALARPFVRKKTACVSKTQCIGGLGPINPYLGGGGTVGVKYPENHNP